MLIRTLYAIKNNLLSKKVDVSSAKYGNFRSLEFTFSFNQLLSSEEKAYLAGIIDGEGSIMLTRFHKNQFPAPCITIASTSLELLQWVKNKSGFGLIKLKKNYNPLVHKDSYTYVAKYDEAILLLKEIEPYLVIEQKKKRAQMILNEYKSLTPRNGIYSEELLKKKEEFYTRFISV